MSISDKKWSFILRLTQIGVASIPLAIGVLALLNDITGFASGVKMVVEPLITMQGQTDQTWRALPGATATFVYICMFLAEFLVGLLTSIGIVIMLKNINNDYNFFEQGKRWIYLACGLGIIIWGLGFFEIGGDWFLAWRNNSLASFQQGSLMYVLEITVTFLYLKLLQE
jgi:predicted small integral membrane protein